MITILCAGSRGDFQPYIALAQQLKKMGKDVRIAGGKSFEGFIRGYGIDFYLIEADIEALKKSGKRGILLGMGKPANLPESIIAIDSIPHTWLFERVSAVCHHGGAGTTAAGFKAGVPSVIIPFSNDQFAWAHRSYDLGVGAKPISKKDLTADNLAAAITYALSEPIVSNAKGLGEKIATENGALECAKIIMKTLDFDQPVNQEVALTL